MGSTLPDPNHADSSVFAITFNEARTEVLLVRRRDMPLWVFPGGGVDPGEGAEAAALREFAEETGFEGRIVRKVGEYTATNFLTRPAHLYEVCIDSGEMLLTSETSDIGFFPLDALPAGMFKLHVAWLPDALPKKGAMIVRPQIEVSLLRTLGEVFRHPLWILRYFLNRFGMGFPVADRPGIKKRR